MTVYRNKVTDRLKPWSQLHSEWESGPYMKTEPKDHISYPNKSSYYEGNGYLHTNLCFSHLILTKFSLKELNVSISVIKLKLSSQI